MYQFLEIIARSRSVDSLPSLKSIYKKVNAKISQGVYAPEELVHVDEAWKNGEKVTIADGTEVQLVQRITCAGHSLYEMQESPAYKIDKNLYLCGTCHTLSRKYESLSEEVIFPVNWPLSDAQFWLNNAYPWKFAKIIADAKDKSSLPRIKDILAELKELELIDECIFAEEKQAMENSWIEGMTIIIADGSRIKLAFSKKCVLHRFNEPHIKNSYQVEENLYICANCLSVVTERKDILERHPSVEEVLLFPKDWTNSGVDAWLENVERRAEAFKESNQ